MQNFRLAIVDYPKLLLENKPAMTLFIDMIRSKQKGFEQSSLEYVTLDPLDMISTHILVYDANDIFQPKPVLCLRVCYQNRTKKHNLLLPIEKYCTALPPEGMESYTAFKNKKENIVDCNAWFVDPAYSFSKTKVPLSEIAILATTLFILRTGNDHLLGATNEKYKASRWFNPIGNLIKPVIFEHPSVRDPHQFTILDGFKTDWILGAYEKYSSLIESCYEVLPDPKLTGEPQMSVKEVYAQLTSESNTGLKAA